jgi:hypothetical protein
MPRTPKPFHHAFTYDAEHRHAVREALELGGAEISVLESSACEAAGVVRDDDLARLRNALKACGEIGRLARYFAAVERPASGKIAHDHAATRNPDA